MMTVKQLAISTENLVHRLLCKCPIESCEQGHRRGQGFGLVKVWRRDKKYALSQRWSHRDEPTRATAGQRLRERNLWSPPRPRCFSCLSFGVCVRDCWGARLAAFPPASPERQQEEGAAERRPGGKEKEEPHTLAFCMPWLIFTAQHRAPVASRPPPRALRGRAEPPAAAEPAPLASRERAMPAAALARPACRLPPARLWGLRLQGCAPSPGHQRGDGGCPLPRSPQISSVPDGDAQSPRVSVRIPRRFCSRMRVSSCQGGLAASRRVALWVASKIEMFKRTCAALNIYLTFYTFCLFIFTYICIYKVYFISLWRKIPNQCHPFSQACFPSSKGDSTSARDWFVQPVLG